MPLISVVMPAYNSEKYIAEAIESVINQTFLDWELVIVDDCSNDKTYEIANKYSKIDDRIRVFKFETNTGSAYLPRKKAIELSLSDSILSLDSDDFLEKEYIEKLYNRQKETNLDIILARFIAVSEFGVQNKENKLPKDNFDFNSIITGNDAVKKTIGEWEIFCNGALINKQIYTLVWEKYDSDYIGMNADELLSRFILVSVDKVAFSRADYFYRINSQSITRKFSLKIFDVIETNKLLKDFVNVYVKDNKKEIEKLEHQRWRSLLTCSIHLLERKKEIERTSYESIFKRIEEEWNNINWHHIRYKSTIDIIIPIMSLNFKFYIFVLKKWIYVKPLKKLQVNFKRNSNIRKCTNF